MPAPTPLFDAEFRALLEHLYLAWRRGGAAGAGGAGGARTGGRLDFAGHRAYAPGDDPRRLDWNVYARTGAPFVKEFAREEERALHLVLDGSASVGAPEPPSSSPKPQAPSLTAFARKALRLRQAAAALIFVALRRGARVRLWPFGAAEAAAGRTRGPASATATGADTPRGWYRHEREWDRALDDLARLPAGVAGGPSAALAVLAGSATTGQRVLLLSDLAFDLDQVRGMEGVAGRGATVTVVHALAACDTEPPPPGRWELADAETGATLRVDSGGGFAARFARTLEEWRAEWRARCRRAGARYLALDLEQPLPDLVRALFAAEHP